MEDHNPYSSPQSGPGFAIIDERSRLWSAFLIAPIFAPMGAAIALAAIGVLIQMTQPNPALTPMSFVLGPICTLVAGTPIAYGVAGVIGIPGVLWLRSHNRLSAASVHGVGLLCSAVLGLAVVLLGLFLITIGFTPLSDLLEIVFSGVVTALVLSPFSILSTTVFWWIAIRPSRSNVEAVGSDGSR